MTRAFALAGLALAILSYGFVLLPIDLGIWPRVEPVIVAVHAAAAICTLGLAAGCWFGETAALRAVRHPVVLIALFIAAWSTLVAPFAEFPLLSLVGMPQSGEGTLLKADFAAFLAAGLVLRGNRRAGDVLTGLAMAMSWLAAALVVLVPSARVWGIGDYLAFYSFPVAVLVACRVGGTKGALLGLGAALPSLVISTNYAALAALIVLGGPSYLVARRATRWARGAAVALVVMVPFTAILAVAVAGSQDWINSLRSRELILSVVAHELADHPWKLIVGQGWGHTGETFFRYLTSTRATIWNESWDVVFRDHFHSLNYVVEPLLSAGFPAAVAALALFAAIPLYAPNRRLALAAAFAAAHGALAALWFELPMTVPVSALAIAALVAPVRARAPSLTAPLLAGLAIAQLAVAAILLAWGLNMRGALARDTACDAWPAEQWRASLGLRAAFLDLEKATIERYRRNEILDRTTLARIDARRCAVDARAAATRSAMLASATVLFRSDVALTGAYAAQHPGFAATLDDWPSRVRTLLALAPLRSDLAVPYLATLVRRGAFAEVGAFAAELLSRHGTDPVGLWFSGLSLIESPDPARQRLGIARLREGLDRGIERILPVPGELKARIYGLSRGDAPTPPPPER